MNPLKQTELNLDFMNFKEEQKVKLFMQKDSATWKSDSAEERQRHLVVWHCCLSKKVLVETKFCRQRDREEKRWLDKYELLKIISCEMDKKQNLNYGFVKQYNSVRNFDIVLNQPI